MYVKFLLEIWINLSVYVCEVPSGDLNPNSYFHTPQVIIFVEWPSHQDCAVILIRYTVTTIFCQKSKTTSNL